MFVKSKLNILIVVLLIFSTMLFSSTTGKIKGSVIDKQGNPIGGANIIINGTTMGAKSDSIGFYYIIGVRATLYDVQCKCVGYSTKVFENVKIRVGYRQN